ncbi:MAG: zinc-binding dehydrogenase [Ardenticatenaceae bacterium]|nr:zinc-binding dehydrogenase [Anaerolineales bacterium]MCB8941431.1 zinc-binding dehydrogenase [Ardenticatenaceae bacterium]MCB8972787.1 zinc-binding dehydrogenase [Ardenticatenaceae bacterium]
MQQIWIQTAGPPEILRLQNGTDPIPRSGEVRIRVEAVGVNFADILGRLGIYPDAPKMPYVPGYEVSGKIDLLGQGVPDFREGDAVFALTQFGGYSDVVCVPYKQVFKRLEWMNAQDAAAIPLTYLTSYMMLVVMGSVKAGDRVLIHGAAGGVGLAALDLCRILGAETLGTASPAKHEYLLAHGLNHAIDYRNQDYERVVMDLTGGKGVHVVLDPLGGIHWPKNYRLLMPSGRLIHFGVSSLASGKRRSWWSVFRGLVMLPFYTPLKLMSDNKAIIGVNLGHMWAHASMMRPWMKQIVAWYDEALFRPKIDRTFAFTEAVAAHHYLQDRKNIGKVLLLP